MKSIFFFFFYYLYLLHGVMLISYSADCVKAKISITVVKFSLCQSTVSTTSTLNYIKVYPFECEDVTYVQKLTVFATLVQL